MAWTRRDFTYPLLFIYPLLFTTLVIVFSEHPPYFTVQFGTNSSYPSERLYNDRYLSKTRSTLLEEYFDKMIEEYTKSHEMVNKPEKIDEGFFSSDLLYKTSPAFNRMIEYFQSQKMANKSEKEEGEKLVSDPRKWQFKVDLDILTGKKTYIGKIKVKVKSTLNASGRQIETGENIRMKIEYEIGKISDKKLREAGSENKMVIKMDSTNRYGPNKMKSQPLDFFKINVKESFEKRKESITDKSLKTRRNATYIQNKKRNHHKVKLQETIINKLPKNKFKMTKTQQEVVASRKIKRNESDKRINVSGPKNINEKWIGERYEKVKIPRNTVNHESKQQKKLKVKKQIQKKRDNGLNQEINKRQEKHDDVASSKYEMAKQYERQLVFLNPRKEKDRDYDYSNKEENINEGSNDGVKVIEFKPASPHQDGEKIFQNGIRFEDILRRFFPFQTMRERNKRSVDSEETVDEEQHDDITDENAKDDNVDNSRVLVKRGDAANVAAKIAQTNKVEQLDENLQKDVKDLGKKNLEKRNDKVKLSKKGKLHADKSDVLDATDKSKQTVEADKSVKVKRHDDDDDDGGDDDTQRMIVTGDEIMDKQSDEAQEEDEEQEEEEEEEEKEKYVKRDQRAKRYRPKRFYIDVEDSDSDGRRTKRYDNELRQGNDASYDKMNRRRRYYYDDDDYRPKRHEDDDDDPMEDYQRREREGGDNGDVMRDEYERQQGQESKGEEDEDEEEEELKDDEEEQEEEEEDLDKKQKSKERLSERELEDVEDKADIAKRSETQEKSSDKLDVIAADETAEKKEKKLVLKANEELESAKRETPDQLKLANVEAKLQAENKKQAKVRRLLGDETRSVEAIKKKLAKQSKKQGKEKEAQELAEQAHASEKRTAEERGDVEDDLDSYFADRRRRYIRSDRQSRDAVIQDAMKQQNDEAVTREKIKHEQASDAVLQNIIDKKIEQI